MLFSQLSAGTYFSFTPTSNIFKIKEINNTRAVYVSSSSKNVTITYQNKIWSSKAFIRTPLF